MSLASSNARKLIFAAWVTMETSKLEISVLTSFNCSVQIWITMILFLFTLQCTSIVLVDRKNYYESIYDRLWIPIVIKLALLELELLKWKKMIRVRGRGKARGALEGRFRFQFLDLVVRRLISWYKLWYLIRACSIQR